MRNALVKLVRDLLAGVFWLIAGAVALAVLMLVTAMCFIPFYLGPVGALMLLMVTAATVQLLRRRRGTAVLRYVDQAVRLNLPLPRMLHAAQLGEGLITRHRLQRLSDALSEGTSLEAALRRHVRELPERALGLIDAAARTGQLPTVMSHLLETERHEQRRDQAERIILFVYIVLVVLTTVTTFAAVVTFIIPQYLEMLNDFGVDPPPSTMILVEHGIDTTRLLLPAAGLIALSLAGRSLWTLLHGRPDGRLIPGGLADPLIWRLPLLGAVARHRGLADACHALAFSLEAGLPLDRAAENAAQLPISTVLRRRLRGLATAVREGQSVSEAMRRARMPRLMRGMFATAATEHDAQGVFEFLHRYHAERDSRLTGVLRALGGPVAVLVLAACVGVVAHALMAPLVELMWAGIEMADGGF